MSDVQSMMGAIAVIVVCSLFVIRAILVYKGNTKLFGKFDKYFPFAVIAAKWVEEKVPDDFGSNEEDKSVAKSVHKLDLFLKKFLELTEKHTGMPATEELKAEAMKWSAILADRMKK